MIYIYIFNFIDFWNIIKHFDKEEENFNKICKHGLNSNVNKESLLAVYISKGVNNKKVNYYSFPIIKKERWLKGAKTKYDIPQYIEGIPEGFAIFCTTKEAGKVRKYQEQIERRNKNKNNKNETNNKKNDEKDLNEDLNKEVEDMDVVNKRMIAGAMKMDHNEINKKNDNNNDKDKNKDKDKDDEDNKELKLSDELQEPVPRNDHKYCHICKTKFEKYLKHIKSYSHFDNLQRHQTFFNRFKKSFERIIHFWDVKKGRIPKNKNNVDSNKIKLLSPVKSEDISTKEASFPENKNIINNIINLLNTNNNPIIKKNNENINNNINKNNKNFIIKNNNNNNCEINKNSNNNNITSMNNNTKKITNIIPNIDLNKNSKNFSLSNNQNLIHNNKSEDKSSKKNNNMNPSSAFTHNQTTTKKKYNENIIFNLTYSHNHNIHNNHNNHNSRSLSNANVSTKLFLSNDKSKNNNICNINNNNENNNNGVKTVNYISISQKDEDLIIKLPIQNNIKNYNDEKVTNSQPKKKFVTKCYPKFSTLQTYQLPKPKKRKKNEIYRGGDIFVISIPKKIDFDYFPVLSIDNSKKLINKNIIFFQ